jgi:hypothetical protein
LSSSRHDEQQLKIVCHMSQYNLWLNFTPSLQAGPICVHSLADHKPPAELFRSAYDTPGLLEMSLVDVYPIQLGSSLGLRLSEQRLEVSHAGGELSALADLRDEWQKSYVIHVYYPETAVG